MIDTHIITGFLGVGKTSVIRQLIQQKPACEKWVVMVNEFGELGVDNLLMGNAASVIVKQVAGGCACCLALLPFQMSLNQVIKQHRPDRIIIEPSGLGHPDNLIKLLRGEFYEQVLQLAPVITVLDSRQLSIEKYTSHDIYRRQLNVADLFVANKHDLASVADESAFTALQRQYQRPGEWIEQGHLSWQDFMRPLPAHPARWLVTAAISSEPYSSVNISLIRSQNFSKVLLQSLVQKHQWQRVKGCIKLDGKSVLLNWVDGDGEILSAQVADEQAYFIEIIAQQKLAEQDVKQLLLTALV